MKFVKFPNGKMWKVDNDGWIKGIVLVDDYENISSLEDRLDAISESATGSVCGLSDIYYDYLGGDFVEFRGCAEELPCNEDDYEEYDFEVMDINSEYFKNTLKRQYGLDDVEADHAIQNLDNEYDNESVVKVLSNGREIRMPAYPDECSYVRVVIDGFEIAYWIEDEWRDDPAIVMGALLGCARSGVNY